MSHYRSGAFQPFLTFRSLGVTGGLNTRNTRVDYSQMHASPSDSSTEQPVPTVFNHRVLAFYYPWYGNPAGPSGQCYHWVGVSQSLIVSTTDYPMVGAYDSQDPAVIGAQVLMVRAAGIDGFISSWWGTHSFEDNSFQVLLRLARTDLHDQSRVESGLLERTTRKPFTSLDVLISNSTCGD
jgi:hypothetical protein